LSYSVVTIFLTICGGMRWGNAMNQDAKVGLIVLCFVALGVLFAVESFRTPHQQLDPRFILVVIMIGVIWFAARKRR
jgi:hypothetical protein